MFVETLFNEDGCLMQLPPPLPPKKTPHNLVFIFNQSRRTIEFVRQTPRITAEKGYSFIKCDFFFLFYPEISDALHILRLCLPGAC